MGANTRVRIIAAAVLGVGLAGSGLMNSVLAASVGRHELA